MAKVEVLSTNPSYIVHDLLDNKQDCYCRLKNSDGSWKEGEVCRFLYLTK